MLMLTIAPNNYKVNSQTINQNPYSTTETEKVDTKLAAAQHANLLSLIPNNVNYIIDKDNGIPDIVYCASAGLSLPRLPEPIVILPYMKHTQRQNENKYYEEIFNDLRIRTVDFPGSEKAPFEGTGEAVWLLGGTVLILGYGYRSTKESVRIMRKLIVDIYSTYNVLPPHIISVHMKSFKYYHLDLALVAFSETDIIVYDDAFNSKDLKKLQAILGEKSVHVISSPLPFVLNAVVTETSYICSDICDDKTKTELEKITGKKVVRVDVSEFLKGGGSVKCLIFKIYENNLHKRKHYKSSTPAQKQGVSPKPKATSPKA